MDTIGGRIKALRKMQSIDKTLEKFGTRIGITPASLSAIENGKTNPSKQTIRAICQEFGIDEIWLRTGAGEPYRPKGREEELTELMTELMADRPEAFRSRLITALLRFDPEGAEWAALERIYESVAEEAKKEHGG